VGEITGCHHCIVLEDLEGNLWDSDGMVLITVVGWERCKATDEEMNM
jgi:hypothetical protein